MPAQKISTRPTSARRLPGIARLAVGLEIFLSIGALYGGGSLILAPDGHLLGIPISLLAGTPFRSFLVPGICLFSFVGLAPLLAAAISIRRQEIAPLAAVAVGLTLIGWITVEMVALAGVGSLAWAFYLVLGTSIAAVGLAWWRSSRSINGRPGASATASRLCSGFAYEHTSHARLGQNESPRRDIPQTGYGQSPSPGAAGRMATSRRSRRQRRNCFGRQRCNRRNCIWSPDELRAHSCGSGIGRRSDGDGRWRIRLGQLAARR